jgi:hypothetical protein
MEGRRTSKAEKMFLRRTGKAVEKTKRHFITLLTQEICEIKETVEREQIIKLNVVEFVWRKYVNGIFISCLLTS